jgi:hypothetical protein
VWQQIKKENNMSNESNIVDIYCPSAGASGMTAKRWSLSGNPTPNSNVRTIQVQGIGDLNDQNPYDYVAFQTALINGSDELNWVTCRYPDGRYMIVYKDDTLWLKNS